MRACPAMEQDLAYYERLPPGHNEKNYHYLLRCARRILERNRMNKFREEVSQGFRSASGTAAPATNSKGEGKGKSKGDGKTKKGTGKQDFTQSATGKGQQKSSPTKVALGNRQPNTPSSPKKEICPFHLKGKCKNGEACPKAHNPPCRFEKMPGGCRRGKACLFPH